LSNASAPGCAGGGGAHRLEVVAAPADRRRGGAAGSVLPTAPLGASAAAISPSAGREGAEEAVSLFRLASHCAPGVNGRDDAAAALARPPNVARAATTSRALHACGAEGNAAPRHQELRRIQVIGHRNRQDRRPRARGVDSEHLRAAIDDCSGVRQREVLEDNGVHDRRLSRPRHRPVCHGCRSHCRGCSPTIASAISAASSPRRRPAYRLTRPFRPQTNGKTERLICTLLHEWEYAQACRVSRWRAAALTRYLTYFDTRRHRDVRPS
jgi:hypothetical protein